MIIGLIIEVMLIFFYSPLVDWSFYLPNRLLVVLISPLYFFILFYFLK